ncbi:HlyD family efflux transporter periplasmic adaptor subunit [Arcicella sp. LKC2W]|uniref:efflux RND transporter periplasmic adaptor subunit n=1 Tax=Arcicella sp. LKC2W TaxID=2984198 RepID=UPI002B21A552|nr:HlyD family efflux transporter periplasmic adaptor subunit [Arcicella sp. LKC2W]MEA5461302.1 HlyD family efflux transporter periplasmic adaptor subunit [Arcicella sp. LKC2W]
MAKKSSNKIWWILGGVIVLLGGGLFIAKKQGLIGKEPSTEVEFTKAKKADIIERVSASGKIQPEIEVKLSPDVSGEIVGLYVNEGDSVRAGQLLLKIKPDNYESLLARAEAQVNSSKASVEQSKAIQSQSESRLLKAKIDYDRNKRLHDDKVISDADFDQFNSQYLVAKQDVESAKANVQSASFNVKSSEAALKEARTNLTKTTIYAPQSGTVSKLNVELGERVVGTSQMAGTELLRIANLNKMEVRVNVNENDITRVSMNDTVIIDVDSYSASGRKFKGVVYEIASSANGLSTTSAAAVSTDAVTEFEVKIRVLRQSYSDLIVGKRSYPLKPGMTASVEIITDRKNGVLSVPLASVTTRDPSLKTDGEAKKEGEEDNNQEPEKVIKKDKIKEVVFVVDKANKAKLREVKTGISDFENIEILSGLADGETIISGPYITVSKKLKEGEIVTKKKAEEKKKK